MFLSQILENNFETNYLDLNNFHIRPLNNTNNEWLKCVFCEAELLDLESSTYGVTFDNNIFNNTVIIPFNNSNQLFYIFQDNEFYKNIPDGSNITVGFRLSGLSNIDIVNQIDQYYTSVPKETI